jgi:riboflavin biosynthesis pyrimidine reductase
LNTVLRLFPAPVESLTLQGLYLDHALRQREDTARAFVYSNFVASLDGRIALGSAHSSGFAIPKSITNSLDWRLFQELAAQADALIVSGRYIRQLARGAAQDTLPLSEHPAYRDLYAWRHAQGLTSQPAVVVVSEGLDLPRIEALSRDRSVFVATGSKANTADVRALERRGIAVIVAGPGRWVEGRRLREALEQRGLMVVYSIAGPQIAAMLLADHALDRLYLTHVHRILGGHDYTTLTEGPRLSPPVDFELFALYYHPVSEKSAGQMFSVYSAVNREPI